MDDDILGATNGPETAGGDLQGMTQQRIIAEEQVQRATRSPLLETQSSHSNDSTAPSNTKKSSSGTPRHSGLFASVWGTHALNRIVNKNDPEDSVEFGAETSGTEFFPNVSTGISSLVGQITAKTPLRVRQYASLAATTAMKTRDKASITLGHFTRKSQEGGPPTSPSGESYVDGAPDREKETYQARSAGTPIVAQDYVKSLGSTTGSGKSIPEEMKSYQSRETLDKSVTSLKTTYQSKDESQGSPPSRRGALFSEQEPIRVAMRLLAVACVEMGATYSVVDRLLWSEFSKMSLEQEFDTWTGLERFMKATPKSRLSHLVGEVLRKHFCYRHHKASPIMSVLTAAIVKTLEILVDYTSKTGNDRPWKQCESTDEGILGHRLFAVEGFAEYINETLRLVGYPLSDNKVSMLKKGSLPDRMILHKDSALVILWEVWESKSRQGYEGMLRGVYKDPCSPIAHQASTSTSGSISDLGVPSSFVIPTNSSDEEGAQDLKPSAKVKYDATSYIGWNDSTVVYVAKLYTQTMKECPIAQVAQEFTQLHTSQLGALYRVFKYMRAEKWQMFMTESTSDAWLEEIEFRLQEAFTTDFWFNAPPQKYLISRLLEEYVIRQIPEFLAGYAHSYIRGDTTDHFLQVQMTSSKSFTKGWNEAVWSATKFGTTRLMEKEDKEGRRLHIVSDPDTSPIESGTNATDDDQKLPDEEPNLQLEKESTGTQQWQANDVEFPLLSPPDGQSHCGGYYVRHSANNVTWKSYIPPLKVEQLPRNLPYVRAHWEGIVLHDGSTVIGKTPTGNFVVHRPAEVGITKGHPPAIKNPLKTVSREDIGSYVMPNDHGEAPQVRYEADPQPSKQVHPFKEEVQGEHHGAPDAYVRRPTVNFQEHSVPRITYGEEPERVVEKQRGPNAHDRLKSFSTPLRPTTRHWSFSTPYVQPSKRYAGQESPSTIAGTHTTTAYHMGMSTSGHTPGQQGSKPREPHTVDLSQGSGFSGGRRDPNDRGSGSGGGGSGPPGGPSSTSPHGTGGNRGNPGGGGGGGSPPPPISPHIHGGGVPKPFQCKPDLKAYMDYKQPEEYASWIEDTVAVMRAQGLGELLDPYYTPTVDERDSFQAKQAFTYMMLKKKVKTLTGTRIVKNYKAEYDAQAVLLELAKEGMQSTYAILAGRQLLSKLTSQKFDPRNGKMSAMEFITRFETMVEQYNDQQEHTGTQLSDDFKKILLASSVSSVTILRSISDREQESLVKGGRVFDYHEYAAILKAQAVLFDEQFAGRRSVNMSSFGELVDDESGAPDADGVSVNVLRRRNPGVSMNKETWESLSAEGKATWDKLDDSDKSKVLRYATKRAEKGGISANMTSLSTDDSDHGEDSDDSVSVALMEAEINNTLVQARKDAHAGDPRRVLGEKSPKKGMTQVKNVNFLGVHHVQPHNAIDDAIERYWNPTPDSVSDF